MASWELYPIILKQVDALQLFRTDSEGLLQGNKREIRKGLINMSIFLSLSLYIYIYIS